MKNRVLIVGGDQRAVSLIHAFRGAGGVRLVGVCDTRGDSPAMLAAGELKIRTYMNLAALLDKKKVDIIIETSDSREFQKILHRITPKEVSVIDARAAEMIINIARRSEKEVDRMKSEFISTTSHELRTPLAAIKESVMLVLDETTGKIGKEQNHFLDIARRNIDRLTQLINDLLDISKIETGRMELKMVKTDLSKLISKILPSMELLAAERKIVLKRRITGGLPKVECDEDRVTQILVNLIGNAIKFTPKEGEITVRISRLRYASKGEYVEISVSDTGQGIEKKDMGRLFTRFGQLDGSLTRRPGGTGLGLAICKELVEMHGGRIWVDSKPGEGSTFHFVLPAKR